MDPFTIFILGSALLGVGAGIAIFVAILTFSILTEWFQEHEAIATKEENIAVTVENAIENGKATTVQGIFNKNKKEFVQKRVIEHNKVDQEVRDLHRNSKVVIWQ
ncbi:MULTISPECIES: hypothetical protein [unclassified Tolypothrix]|uniref:hypothetical protein n=1 Tax=unclassified Tolypothrix TaxID=2649714 RepID=UPI0005F79750|nr:MULTISPECIES: hypothetical protein [unclassified Tolypothrix]MBE9087621.1 hypothetical protein [Tolypothrix sp. LEGE 11397]UYD27232.1 hypothetical protein HGR01_03775 [Tolypothrix sp. PCC 7712]UYD36910.1 hypothetical protein HG267_14970 [Tolypothrix sp. PCC 7601]BAY93380.1 hypothetical protein NIES3275_54190 [Microchaete diplosiphon NIES-3275]